MALAWNGGLGTQRQRHAVVVRWWYHCRFSLYLVRQRQTAGGSMYLRMRPGYVLSLPSTQAVWRERFIL